MTENKDLTTLTDDERAVWRAVYAAEWLSAYDSRFPKVDNASRAANLANRAVLQLRDYRERKGGDPDAGWIIEWVPPSDKEARVALEKLRGAK